MKGSTQTKTSAYSKNSRDLHREGSAEAVPASVGDFADEGMCTVRRVMPFARQEMSSGGGLALRAAISRDSVVTKGVMCAAY